MSGEAPYYYGSAENKLNSKNQVAIPARFRAVLPEEDKNKNYVLVRGADACLYLYTHRQFGVVMEKVRQVAEERGDRAYFRSFMAEAHAVEIDTQGRFVLPPAFMQAAGIKGPGILFIGVGARIEIWDPEAYESHRERSEQFRERLREDTNRIFGI